MLYYSNSTSEIFNFLKKAIFLMQKFQIISNLDELLKSEQFTMKFLYLVSEC